MTGQLLHSNASGTLPLFALHLRALVIVYSPASSPPPLLSLSPLPPRLPPVALSPLLPPSPLPPLLPLSPLPPLSLLPPLLPPRLLSPQRVPELPRRLPTFPPRQPSAPTTRAPYHRRSRGERDLGAAGAEQPHSKIVYSRLLQTVLVFIHTPRLGRFIAGASCVRVVLSRKL